MLDLGSEPLLKTCSPTLWGEERRPITCAYSALPRLTSALAKLQFTVQFTRWLIGHLAQIVLEPALQRDLFLFLSQPEEDPFAARQFPSFPWQGRISCCPAVKRQFERDAVRLIQLRSGSGAISRGGGIMPPPGEVNSPLQGQITLLPAVDSL